ncbi:MAG: ferrous iron transporter B [Clostridia bacterium]|nr:ferrous iron transporter B [Clostridia bacterium]MBQ5792614.1 ferrous iron transporter B [Clostridia bacterium]
MEQSKIRIALAGNPNAGKTTLFNALTGSNQFVGNWPGVTVEKKEGKIKKYDNVILTDLPGIYSLSPYTPEEVVARNYLVGERPDVILNIVDGSNLERNLYLTTQLTELGIPVVIAINMIDVVRKNGDTLDIEALSKKLGCPVVEISALKGTGIEEAAEAAIAAAGTKAPAPSHNFSGAVEHAIAHIEEAAVHGMPEEQQRWYAIKIFERDRMVLDQLAMPEEKVAHIEHDIVMAEAELDDESESIIANERYNYIATLLTGCYKRKNTSRMTVSDKIDRVVTNRILALPIFVVIMFLVYYISVSTVGTWVTDFTNDGLFGDEWAVPVIGAQKYNDAVDTYAEENLLNHAVMLPVLEQAHDAGVVGADEILAAVQEGDIGAFEEAYGSYNDALLEAGYDITAEADAVLENTPAIGDYRMMVPGIPVLVEQGLNAIGCADWLQALVLDGIVGGVGAVLGFVPQMVVLFILLAFLEACGYMARIAFVLDRIFRRFGLSGKSFIPMLIGTGCGVPGIMASRTIENEKDRRMTVITTTFIPCGAKLPIIAMIAGSLFGGAWWVAPVAYFIGIAAVILSGIMLKKTKMFSGEASPFVMELPAYHWPTPSNIWHSVWERTWSFVKKAGTVILLSAVIIWAGSSFGFVDGKFLFNPEMDMANSLLGIVGNALKWIFIPLGFGSIEATVATFMGLVAKEEVVAVFGVLDFVGMTRLAGFSFLIFNLLCAPCFAAMGAIRREMNSAKWTAFAIGYQCVFAYAVSLIIYQLGSAFTGKVNVVGLIAAVAVILFGLYMLVRPNKYAQKAKKSK